MPNNEICISGESEGNEMLKYAPNENRGSHSSPKNSRLFFGYKKKRLKWIQNNLFWVSNLFKVMVLAQGCIAFKADESGKLS